MEFAHFTNVLRCVAERVVPIFHPTHSIALLINMERIVSALIEATHKAQSQCNTHGILSTV